MKDYLISLFIDNELDLDEKITFVETVHSDSAFTAETVGLLKQEKRLRVLPAVRLPAAPVIREVQAPRWSFFSFWLKPLAGFAAALLLVSLFTLQRRPLAVPREQPHRFVIYLPETTQARIAGTFTGWKPVPMEPVGTSGYWTLTLTIPVGEHRYSYLVEEGRQLADPTVAVREQDDFGGENSVIEVQVAAI